MRRSDDVREAVDELLAEQKRAWIRRVVYARERRESDRAPRAQGLAIIGRIGALVLMTALGGVIGAVRGDVPTGLVVGLILGVVLGSSHPHRPSESPWVRAAPDRTPCPHLLSS